MEPIIGRVLAKFGNDISTDDMSSGKYVTSTKPEELAKICLRDLDPEFPRKMAEGGILVAGNNFGCGSSREWAPIALKAAGVKAVVAEEFARIFYRNALNIGLPIIECHGVSEVVELGDELEIVPSSGNIHNLTKGILINGLPLPEFLLQRMEVGGLAEFLRRRIRDSR